MNFVKKLLEENRSEEAGGSEELQKRLWDFISEKLAQIFHLLTRARELLAEKAMEHVGSPELKLLVAAASEKFYQLSGFLDETLRSEAVHQWGHWALTVALPLAAGFVFLYYFFYYVLYCLCILLRFLWNIFCLLLRAVGVGIMKAPGIAHLLIPRVLFNMSPRLFFAGSRAIMKVATSKIGLIVLASSGVLYALKCFRER